MDRHRVKQPQPVWLFYSTLAWIVVFPFETSLYHVASLSLLLALIYTKLRTKTPPISTPFVYGLVGFQLSLLLSSLLSNHPSDALLISLKLQWRLFLPGFAVYFIVKNNPHRFNWIVSTLLISALIQSLDGLSQLALPVDLLRQRPLHNGLRMTGAIFNPNPFGLFMGLSLLLLVQQSVKNRFSFNHMHAALSIIGICLMVFCLFKSGSRGAWLATTAGLLCWILIEAKPYRLRIGLTAIALGTAGSHWINFQQQETWLIRLDIWHIAITEWLASPITGQGPGALRHLDLPWHGAVIVHNVLLDILYCLGIIGLAVLIYLIVLLSKHLIANRSQPHTSIITSGLLLIGVAGLFDYSLLESSMYQSLLATLIGLGFCHFPVNGNTSSNQLNLTHSSHDP